MADQGEKRALVSLKDRSRMVSFRGGLDKLLSAIQVCFADVLSGHNQNDLLLQVHFYNYLVLTTISVAVDNFAKVVQI